MKYKYFLILKGTNKDLATYEFETLWQVYFEEDVKLKQLQNTVYIFESKNLLEKDNEFLYRLTFTNHISLCKFEGDFEEFKKKINEFDLKKYDGLKFAIKTKRLTDDFNIGTQNRTLAKPIFDLFTNPKVDLENADVEFYFFFKDENNFSFCEKIYQNNKDYLRRMPKLRPVVMPYTLKSDMARAAINLLGLKKGVVMDPFCGIGGILLEAKDMKFEIIANDISWNDLKYFKENFKHYFPNEKYHRTLADCKTLFLKANSVDGIVTDIPYGKSSRKLGLDLYEDFLKSAKVYLKKNARMIVIFANFVDFKRIALKYFEEEIQIDQHINRSMTRHILVLKNSK